jgi:hypothetical protein
MGSSHASKPHHTDIQSAIFTHGIRLLCDDIIHLLYYYTANGRDFQVFFAEFYRILEKSFFHKWQKFAKAGLLFLAR